jgi:hypothetical protein
MRSGLIAFLVTSITLGACHGSEKVTSSLKPPDGSTEIDDADVPGTIIAPSLVQTSTYDGSGELVHPDAVVFPRRWQGRRYWVAGTPYPTGNPAFENPSIYHGFTSREMSVPAGVTNPLAMPSAASYLSDPDLLYDPVRDELRLYYRHTTGSSDQILLITSTNGVQWSSAQLVLTAGRYSLISPAIVRESATSWRMWTVNATAQGCYSLPTELALQQRRSADGITWSEPELVNLRVPRRVAWHWDVQYVAPKGEYWALVAAYPEGTTCSKTAVFFARSPDGTDWTVYPTPLLGAGEFDPLHDLVYRSSFHYHEASDAVSVWFSGARLGNGGFHFAVASARYPYAELLRRVSGASAPTLARAGADNASAELQAARERFEHDFP